MIRKPVAWIAAAASASVALCFLFPDSIQQDGGYHYLFARWAFVHPSLFVGVWARPLFTTLYSLPALGGYPVAKLFTGVISALVAWQTFKLSEKLGVERAPLVIPFLYLQPSFFVLCTDTMTEPLFALVLVIALRLRYAKRAILAAAVLSFSILARPEGLFICGIWTLWSLRDWWRLPSERRRINALIFEITILGLGLVVWWVAALLITAEPLFIVHNWPPSWPATGTIYGQGRWWNYFVRFAEIVPPLLIPAFAIGLWLVVSKAGGLREAGTIFLVFFVIHSILRAFGLMGSAGYPRYFVAISPVLALITLCGWNRLAMMMTQRVRTAVLGIMLALSTFICFCYFDGAEWIRDTRAVNEMHEVAMQNSLPVERFVWSQAYAAIRFDTDPWMNITFSSDHERNIQLLRDSNKGTLVLWESRYGPIWHHVNPADFETAGYELIAKREFVLKGYVLPRSFFGFGGPRHQQMFLFYKR